MITRAQAEAAIGLKVVYRAPHVGKDEPGEEGVITSVNDRGAFVRYGSDVGSKLIRLGDLTLVTLEVSAITDPDSSTSYLCDSPKAPAGATHHMVPNRGSGITVLLCRYCGRSDAKIRKEMGLDVQR